MNALVVSVALVLSFKTGATQNLEIVPEIAVTCYQDRPHEWAARFKVVEPVEIDKIPSIETILKSDCLKIKEKGSNYYFETKLLSLNAYVVGSLMANDADKLFGGDYSRPRKLTRADGRTYDLAKDVIKAYSPGWEKSGANNSDGEVSLSPLIGGTLELNGKKVWISDNRPFDPQSEPKPFTPSQDAKGASGNQSNQDDVSMNSVRVTPIGFTITSSALVSMAGKVIDKLDAKLLELTGVKGRIDGTAKFGKPVRVQDLPDWKREIIESSVVRRFKDFGFPSREAAAGSLGSLTFSESLTGFALRFKIGPGAMTVEIANSPK